MGTVYTRSFGAVESFFRIDSNKVFLHVDKGFP